MAVVAAIEQELELLQDLSALVGSDPLLTQAASGNTSVKSGGALWIKASGRWLAHARSENIFAPASLSEALRKIEAGIDPALAAGSGLSVETAMHAVLPWSVVLHVHSINTIAWAVRSDGRERLAERLAGIEWEWVPYTASGLPLALAVRAAAGRNPAAQVFVLANHGLVVCGEDSWAAEWLLREVELRVAIAPRANPRPAWEVLYRAEMSGSWRVPEDESLHSMAWDPALTTVTSGVLYPCQAIFLTPQITSISADEPATDTGDAFRIIREAGVLVRRRARPVEIATISGLAQVVRRIPANAPVRYLREQEVADLLCADVYRYRDLVAGVVSGKPF
jgi:rhamnose utilization protein RhaD (predicted bifunctional aldolase and dehydrogenase)